MRRAGLVLEYAGYDGLESLVIACAGWFVGQRQELGNASAVSDVTPSRPGGPFYIRSGTDWQPPGRVISRIDIAE